MQEQITITSITSENFAPFGDILDANSAPDIIINQGRCGRHHDRALLDFSGGRAGISVFDSSPVALPYTLDLMERHPLGSQCFMPMTEHPFMVIVGHDKNGQPDQPQAFLVPPHTGINIHRNIWHGVLTPLHGPGLFAVIDRIGDGVNLEEAVIDPPYLVIG